MLSSGNKVTDTLCESRDELALTTACALSLGAAADEVEAATLVLTSVARFGNFVNDKPARADFDVDAAGGRGAAGVRDLTLPSLSRFALLDGEGTGRGATAAFGDFVVEVDTMPDVVLAALLGLEGAATACGAEGLAAAILLVEATG